jgi:hypothetical protein
MKSSRKLRRPPTVYRLSHAVLGPMLKALGISCKDAYELSSGEMDRELAKGESFRLRFHLMICGICRHLPTQFRGLRELVRACEQDPAHDESSDAQLSPEVKERIVEHLKDGFPPKS